MGRAVASPSQLGGLAGRYELPQRGFGQSPGRKRILVYFESHKMLLFAPIAKILGAIKAEVWEGSSPCSNEEPRLTAGFASDSS